MKNLLLLILCFFTLKGVTQNVNWIGNKSVKTYRATGDGTTDDYAAITAAIAATPAGGVLYFPEGTYLVGTSVSVNKTISIQGNGQSRIKVTGNIAAFTLAANGVIIDKLNFHGSGQSGGNGSQFGINCNGYYDFAIRDCAFDSLNGAGLYWVNTTVGSARYGGRVSNCFFNLNNIGFMSAAYGEYVTVIGGTIKNNLIGCSIAGGNVVLSGVDIHDNGVGIKEVDGTNNGHGTISACKINHNSTYNIQVSDVALGLEFIGCQIFDSYIYLKNTVGISFIGCEVAPIAMYFENAKGTRFSSNVFYTGYGFALNNNYNSTVSETFYNNNQYLGGAASGVFIGQDTTAIPVTSSLLDITSTTKGVLFPRMTTTQKNAISSPAEGLIIYDLTLHKLCVYTGGAWQTITSS